MVNETFIKRYGIDPEAAAINTSGFWPIKDRCLVLPDEVKETTDSGLLYKPQTTMEREEMRQLKATLIAVGGMAFEDGEQWKPPLPKVGDRIYVKVAAGVIHPGEDGKDYRIINDNDILGICED